MTSVIEQLLETLADLSDGELKDLKHFLLSQRCIYKPYFEMLMVADMQNTVFFMAQTFGQQSVERIKDILIKMNKTDLVQRLSDRSPGPKSKTVKTKTYSNHKTFVSLSCNFLMSICHFYFLSSFSEKHSVDEHLSAMIHNVRNVTSV